MDSQGGIGPVIVEDSSFCVEPWEPTGGCHMEGQQVEISRESSVMIGRVSLYNKETFGQHEETRLNRLIITDVRDKEAK